MALDVGTDYSTFPDFDPSTTISGLRLVAEHVAREWTTERKALFYAPHVGKHVNGLVNADLEPRELREWEALLEQRAKAIRFFGRGPSDTPVILACPVQITVGDDGATIVSAQIHTEDGVADLVLSLTEAGQKIAAEIRLREAA